MGDLVQTAAWLNRACYYVLQAASKGAVFLFTGTKEQAQPIIKDAAERTGMHYCDSRFVGGLLTNHGQISKGIELMKKMQIEQAQGVWSIESEQMKKKKKSMAARLYRKYVGVQNMDGLPDIMIAVDEFKERHPVMECGK